MCAVWLVSRVVLAPAPPLWAPPLQIGRVRNRNNPSRLSTDVTSSHFCTLCLLGIWPPAARRNNLARVIRPVPGRMRQAHQWIELCRVSAFMRLQQQGMVLLAFCVPFCHHDGDPPAPLCAICVGRRDGPRVRPNCCGIPTQEHQAQRFCQNRCNIGSKVSYCVRHGPFNSDF